MQRHVIDRKDQHGLAATSRHASLKELFMSRLRIRAAVFVCAAVLFSPGDVRANGPQGAEIVIRWTQLLQTTIPPTAGLAANRYYAMLHIAVFDAVNAIERAYTPYLSSPQGSAGASVEAAAAKAARDVLTWLIPSSQATYDAALAEQLQGIPSGLAWQGAEVGARAAAAVIAWRMNDGWSATPPAYLPPPLPGLWQPVPAAAAFTHYPGVVPFALPTATLFMPPPPPQLNSAKYAEDFDEVKTVGSTGSLVRTAEQTLFAFRFAGVGTTNGPFTLWQDVTRDIVRERGLSLVDAARLFTLVSVALHDGLQTTMTSKFAYQVWRPVTAIRRADEDMNDATMPDPTWSSLLANPPYPAYAGNMAALTMSAATALTLALGEDSLPVKVVWPGIPPNLDEERTFAGLGALAQAAADSRIHGGIHFRFDNDAGQEAGANVGRFVHDNFMRPLR
jgi:hypothetical protein